MSTPIIEVTLKGKSPLLMHRFPLEPIEGFAKMTKEKQAKIGEYRDSTTGMLYIPGTNLQRAFISGAAYSKGKGRASLAKIAAACLFVTPEIVSLNTKDYIIDSRAAVNPVTKGRIIVNRPRIDDWEITFNLEYDDILLSESQVRTIVDDTCSKVGYLDFRPERKGSFGRAMVIEWKTE